MWSGSTLQTYTLSPITSVHMTMLPYTLVSTKAESQIIFYLFATTLLGMKLHKKFGASCYCLKHFQQGIVMLSHRICLCRICL